MSFSLFVGSYKRGETAAFSRAILEQYFGQFVTKREPNCLTLNFKEGCSYLYAEDKDFIDGFSIDRPVASVMLYDTLLDVMRSANLALYMPGDCPPLVGRADVAQELPQDMIATLGEPVVLSAGHEIEEWIHRA